MKSILIVDDHPLLLEGLEKVIELEEDLQICGKARSVKEALAMVEASHPDLVLTDLTLPGRNGLELVKDLRAARPDLPVLVMSMHDEMIYAERVLKAGGRGYIMKEAPSEELLKAIGTVLAGDVFASEAVTNHFLQALSMGTGRAQVSFPVGRLTDRELEIFEMIGRGNGNRDIAGQLEISHRTVDAHRVNIRKKLGLADGIALTHFAIRWIESGAQ
jgi:DNA-binding NarL/FixJ family response regulator